MKFICNSILFLLVLSSLISCSNPKAKSGGEVEKTSLGSQPNIIYILADDLGYGDLSFLGQETLKTPNLDKMASEGIFFTRHYTGSSVCAPSRASLLTGKHTGHTSVRGNQPDQLLLDEEITVAEILKKSGYVTGAIGKWGIGHPPPKNDPQRNGFDFFYGYLNMWHAHNFYPEFLYKNGEKVMLENKVIDMDYDLKPSQEGAGVAEVKKEYVHDLFDQQAMEFIETNKDTAFFLYLAYNVPHANNEAGRITGDGMEVKDYGEFADKDWPDPEKGFAKMMQNLDNSVGMVMQKLKEADIEQNTLIIFTSDNGPHQEGNHQMEYFNSNSSLRGMKRDYYEGGIKTPFIARWPDKIEAGTQSDHISAFWDFLPTICEIVDEKKPEQIDGISYLPTLLGNPDQQPKHDYLYWEFYEQGGKQAAIKDHYKAVRLDVRTGNPQPIELYNLKVDPEERQNIADQHPELVAQMQQYMEQAHEPLSFISLFKDETNADTPF